MKVIILLFFGCCLTISASTYSQTITLKGEKIHLKTAISAIYEQAGYVVFVNKQFLEESRPIVLKADNMPLEVFLKEVLKNQQLVYKIEGRNIFLSKEKHVNQEGKRIDGGQIESKIGVQQLIPRVRGRIVDPHGHPISDATIRAASPDGKFLKLQSISDVHGYFQLQDVPTGSYIVITHVTYNIGSLIPVKAEMGDLVIQVNISELEEVVISSGIINRRAESFTGSAVTVTKEQLMQAGSQNVLQSLKNIDPTFRITENLQMGSNPNAMPEIVMRGRSSMPDLTGEYSGNPNEPLFILDGFETSLQRIYDLDMNRVESVTLLKDAAATAIYGAKAGNGVVVVETVQPESGKLRVSYTGNLSMEAPDLTGYNLMNAQEKLQWEKDIGLYSLELPQLANVQEQLYNERFQQVNASGYDTYWLSQPLQTGLGQRHSLFFEGGDDYMKYGATFSYNNITGAMKGSGRNTTSANTNLSYRHKNLMFRNQLEVSQNTANNSPHGSFSQYVAMNPYFIPETDGVITQTLGNLPLMIDAGFQQVDNPLYNAQLNIIDRNTYAQLSDNFYLEWRLLRNLRFTGSLGYVFERNNFDRFTPPNHTEFMNYTEANGLLNYKGKWTRGEGSSRALESNFGLNYNLDIKRHRAFLNTTLNLSDRKTNHNTFVGEGFGSDNVSDISMASYYQRAASPLGSDDHIRNLGLVGIFNYSYDNRFLFDISFRTSASSMYGANSRWGNFWAIGAGWNLHHESFIKDWGIFQQFRLRATTGYTGSQNANAYATLATYNYQSSAYTGLKGTILRGLPNPDLAWQKNLDYNLGLDFELFRSKLSGRIEGYRKTTTSLVTSVTAPPSIGFRTYMANLGKTENNGYELALRYQVFSSPVNRSFFNLSVTAAHNKNMLKDIADAFKSYNDEQDKLVQGTNQMYTRPVARHYEGQSLTAIWAMQSLGIDPASGNELFLDKNGVRTFNWSSTDLMIAGDTEAKINGTFGFTAGYKGFNLSLTCSYRFGGQLFNSTLAERVENVDGMSNVDRRIMQAWSQEGDLAVFRRPEVRPAGAGSFIVYTKPTTRFVQDNNEIYFSAVNLSYDVQSRRILQRLGCERMRATFYTNELLRISSIDVERGTSYPFARNFTFSLQATF